MSHVKPFPDNARKTHDQQYSNSVFFVSVQLAHEIM
jgi:hypothetical protein